ncbi:MAG: TolC family outer membrane protein [Proteobacteria bacterium]|uniref:TolC family outer membrane protein n=1 Tax=Aquabacterium sp. TaxID=1872578 RepID=UPI0035C6E08D|nr:TolC family outer membrane protein [Pseudomonadota bacterium]
MSTRAATSSVLLRPRAARRPVARAVAGLLVGAGLLAQAQLAQAENLVELLDAAKAYDAAYLAARAQAESVRYQADQARALQRPSVNLQASINRNHLDSSAGSFTSPLTGMSSSYSSSSTSRKVGIGARQPLYNAGNNAKVDQAEQSLLAADADLANASNDLTVRVTQAYFDVLGAQDVLTTAQANKAALAEQLAAAKRSFEVGNSTITDTREAQARFDLAGAQEIAATNDLRVKRIALDQLVGRSNVAPTPLRTPVNLDSLSPGQVEDWVGQAASSPSVRKAEVGLQVATLEIDKARAGHLPTLDAVANVARNDISSSNPNAKIAGGAGTSSAIGLEMNLPLYAGNATQNRIREVLQLKEKAEHDVDNARRSVTLGTRQAYFGVQSGLAQVKAYEAAEASAKLALEATQLGYRVGVRINKDVLDAQTQLASTQKDLYKARYDVIVGAVKLRQASGSLKAEDVTELNKLLAN